MADDVQTLLLSINATTEVLRDQLSQAEKATADFQKSTEEKLGSIDAQYYELGQHIGEGIREGVERLKGMAEGAVVALIGENLLETGKKALEFAGSIGEAAEALGVGTTFLQQFHYAALQTGASAETADGALSHLGRSVGEVAQGNTKMIGLFDQLGVKIYDQAGNVRSLEALYPELANAISRIPDAAQRAIASQELLGKGATSLIPLLEQGAGGFDSLAAAADHLGIVLSPELIEHSKQMNQKMAEMKAIFDAELANMIGQNAAQLEGLATSLLKVAGALVQVSNNHPQIVSALLGGAVGGVPGALLGAGLASGDLEKQQAGTAATWRRGSRLLSDRWGTGPLTTGINWLAGGASVMFSSKADLVRAADQDVADKRRQIDALYAQRQRLPAGSRQRSDLNRQIIALGSQAGLTPEVTAPRPNGAGSTTAGTSNINNSAAISAAQTEIAQLTSTRAHATGAALAAINQEIQARQREIGFLKQGVPAEEAKTLASKEASIIAKDANASRRAQKDAEREQEKALQADLAYRKEELTLRKSIVDGARKSTANDELRDALEKQIIGEEADNLKAQIADRLSKGGYGVGKDGKPTAEARTRAQHLTGLVDQDRDQKLANVDLDALSRSVKLASDKAALDLAGTTELAQLDERLATTRSERLAIELRLLDLQERAAKAAQQAIIDDPKSSPDQVAAARTRIGQIDAQHSRNVGLVEQQNENPLASYRRELQGSVGDLGDALGNLKVDGLKGIESALEGMASGAKSAKEAFSEMALNIVQDMEKMLIERALLGALGGQAGSGGGFLASLFGGGKAGSGSLASEGISFEDVFSGGAFADGTDFAPGGLSLVGEEGPEAVYLPRGAQVIPAGRTRSMLSVPPAGSLRQPSISRQQLQAVRGGMGVTTVHVEASPYFDTRVSSVAGDLDRQAAPQTAAAGAQLAGQDAARAHRQDLLKS